MFLRWLISLLKDRGGQRASGGRRAASARGNPTLRYEAGGLSTMGDVPRYPPFTEGLPAASPEQLLETQSKLIRQLQHELEMNDREFNELIRPLLISFAGFVHLLPASKAHHHRGAGGLFRHSLEVALWATRSFQGKLIDGFESGERRKVLQPRWRLAVMVAGLCHDLGKPAYDVVVTDHSGRKTWDVYTHLLHDWLLEMDLDRYFIRWRRNREHKAHERFSHLLTMRVIPPAVLSYLNDADPRIIANMQEVIAGQIPRGSARVLHELVMKADQLSVKRDIKGQRIADSDDTLGVPGAKHVVDAMKRLVDDGNWKPNEKKGPLWVGSDGVYLIWPDAVSDIVRLLERDGVGGLPKSQDSIAEALHDFDIIRSFQTPSGRESYYTRICPEPRVRKRDVPSFKAVCIPEVEVLWDGPQPAPVEVHVGESSLEARQERLEKARAKVAEGDKEKEARSKSRLLKKDHSQPVMEADDPEQPSKTEPPTQQQGSESTASAPSSQHDTDGIESETTPDQSLEGNPEQDQDDKQQQATPSAEPVTSSDEPGAPSDGDSSTDSDVKRATADPERWLAQFDPEVQRIVTDLVAPHVEQRDGMVVVPHTVALKGAGEARKQTIAALSALADPDPKIPAKRTQQVSFGKRRLAALVFSGEHADALSRLAGDTSKTASPPQPEEPTPRPTSRKPDSDKREPLKPHSRASSAVAEQAESKEPTPRDDGPGATEGQPRSPSQRPKKQEATRRKPSAATGRKAATKRSKDGERPKKPRQRPPRKTRQASPEDKQLAQEFIAALEREQPSFPVEREGESIWIDQREALRWYAEKRTSDIPHSKLRMSLYRSGCFTGKKRSTEDGTSLVELRVPEDETEKEHA